MNGQPIQGDPILVEITALTEIGSSAFSLANVRQARIERADLAGLAQAEGAEDDGGPIPKYPRGTLRLEVSDGSVIMPAIEYRSMPSLDLAETPLGYKVRQHVCYMEPVTDNACLATSEESDGSAWDASLGTEEHLVKRWQNRRARRPPR